MFKNGFFIQICLSLISSLVVSQFSFAANGAPSLLPTPVASPSLAKTIDSELHSWCRDLQKSFKKLRWNVDVCEGIDWKVGGYSVRKRPLVYAEYGSHKSGNTTLVFAMVHGDEVTPLYLGIQLAHWLKEYTKTMKADESPHVVVVPLVNPDGFYARPRRTRVNARGVDVNRNFPTRDWHERALAEWKKKYRSNPRRKPGKAPGTEPETIFQQELITRLQPQKVLSIHAPLNMVDYDGPTVLSLARFPKEYVQECQKLRTQLKAVSGGFFPGSLGNYAGQEKGIPTLTLELPSANERHAEKYWKKFQTGIQNMIEFRVPNVAATHAVGTGS